MGGLHLCKDVAAPILAIAGVLVSLCLKLVRNYTPNAQQIYHLSTIPMPVTGVEYEDKAR